ncbi:hypothetical protein SG34_033645 [Thalassomonas viridans]|uniref:Uncharacterized protein n=1 Tax=Thalassomonas viridans TaxID=137584 RepID=A0AAE9ZAE9_9GAMM|nr:hypothetical protein [Thalassomonas viridans]WDE08839.1 hypothetical protein SG34_033645 [Thalassomonas viridans]
MNNEYKIPSLDENSEVNIYRNKTPKQIKSRERNILFGCFMGMLLAILYGGYCWYIGEVPSRQGTIYLKDSPTDFYFHITCIIGVPTIAFLYGAYKYYLAITMFCNEK